MMVDLDISGWDGDRKIGIEGGASIVSDGSGVGSWSEIRGGFRLRHVSINLYQRHQENRKHTPSAVAAAAAAAALALEAFEFF